MIDVAHSMNLDQRLDYPHDPVSFQQQQYFAHTPATFATATSTQQLLDFPFGSFDLTGEQFIEVARPFQSTSCVDLQNWPLIAAMTSQQFPQFPSDQDLPSHQSSASSQSQHNSRQFNDMTTAATFANQHQYSHVDDNPPQQSSMLQQQSSPATPSFVEPSGNYFAVSSPSTSSMPYFPSLVSPPNTTTPTTTQNSAVVLDNNTTVNNNFSSRNTYHGNYTHPPPPQQHTSHQRTTSRMGMSNSQLIANTTDYHNFSPSHHCLPQRAIYQGPIPSSIGSNSRQNHSVHHHQKSIPGTIGANIPSNNYPRQDNVTAASMPTLYLSHGFSTTNNTLLLPLFETNNSNSSSSVTAAWPNKTNSATTITIPQNLSGSSASSPEITSPTKPYSYSGPPKSYYSRLPLYDRPFKCDQCPQSFNRNHDLKRHKRIHLAVKPYPCPHCDKQFSRKDALKRHILVKGCNNTTNNNKRSTSPTNANNNKSESSTTPSVSTRKFDSPIESYVESESPTKSEPTSDNGAYGRI